jgi:UDP-N-acetylmuramate: L-alanyl-gamma-D-glutamyl-meso-diaminopimelate ligase
LSFEGVARRQELKGEVNGIKVVDDFAHHPTAIKLAIAALRQRYAGARLWVLFEPRSNTTKRSVFQTELAQSLALADFAVVAAIADLHKVPVDERLDPDRLSHDIVAFGGKGWYLPGVPEIVDLVAAEAKPGDVIAVLSNGGFGGIHQKLLDRL